MKKEQKLLTDRQKKRRICGYLLCIVLLCGGLWWAADMNGLHLNWEKAFYATEEENGYGPSEKILFWKDDKEEGVMLMGHGRWFPFFSGSVTFRYGIGRLEGTETEGALSVVRLMKSVPFVWQEYYGEAYFFAGEAEAHYVSDMQAIIGSCQEESIEEVFMEWGYRQADGKWTLLEETTAPVDEEGFFWVGISDEKWKEMLLKELWAYTKEGDRLLEGVGVKYLEGRSETGEVLYQKWMDDTGKLVETDPRG